MSFPRYPQYKNSGVEWLGEVPAHWNVIPVKRDLEFITSGSRGWAENYADEGELFIRIANLTRDGIGLDLSDVQRVSAPDGAEGARTRVKLGDVLFSITAFLGSVAVVPDTLEPAYVSQHVALVRLRQNHLSPKWLGYVALSHVGKTWFDTQSYGGTKIQLSLDDVRNLPVPVPPTPEQRAIIDYIDRETAKFDTLVAEQQRLVELLKEKRQAVISHTVTKGLNPDAPMKHSRVEWLGEVPAHWRVGKCGYYVSVLSGFAFPSASFSRNPLHCRLLRGINVGVGALRWDDVVYWEKRSGDGLDEYELHAGDLVLGMDRPLIAEGVRVAKVEAQDLPSLLLQRVASLQSRGGISVDYLKALLASPMFVAHFAPDTTGVSVPHISPEQIESFVIPVPSLPEQESIVAHINDVAARSEALITEAQRAIDLLQERRTALISAAVTGQIDVRGIAANVAA